MVMLFVSVVKGVGANAKGQDDHAHFKGDIMNDINAKQGQAAKKQGQQGAMDGTGQRGPYS